MFASLIILNSKWRSVSQQAPLYALQLSRCPSYSAAHHTLPPQDEDSLPHLRRLFAREIKCNLFEAYLRPQETIINLVSTSISSSSAPGGEAFHFSLSQKGHYILACSSSRIHVLDVTGPEVVVKHEFKILRRPASAKITDDGSLLVVLSTDLRVNVYDLTGEHPKHTKVLELDYAPRAIAISPTGTILAAAYDSGVEVSSLDPTTVPAERRTVKCYAADSLSFSKSGTQLLGTTTQSQNSSTVVLTAPSYDPINLVEQNIGVLWSSSILFPSGSRDCSHATLLPSSSTDESGWTFTYDRVFETFRAVRIDDLRNGTTYFTGPTSDSPSRLLPSTLPAASEAGELVSAGFQGSIWLYGVPEDLEALPNVNNATRYNVQTDPSTSSVTTRRRNSAPSLRSIDRQNSTRTPQWQLLCDGARNTFIEGRKISSLDRVSALAWVNDSHESFHKERLVAVAPGVACQSIQVEDDGMNPVDGGRISILDFDYSLNNGEKRIVTIEVGADEPDILEEEHRDLDTEVALVRRRTVAQRRGNRGNVARSATTVVRTARTPVPPMPSLRNLGDPFTPPSPRRFSIASIPTDRSETLSIDEEREAILDAPYSQTAPRSGPTLRRAATAAATNRRLHPRSVAGEHIEYRRADGREEHPHESDADNWVPPPPPYTKDPVPPLPEHIQRAILAEAAALQRGGLQRTPNFDLDTRGLQRSRTTASTSSNGSRREHFPFPPLRSDSTARQMSTLTMSDSPRPVTSYISPVSPEFDDLYDVSPPGSPGPTPRAPPTPPTPLMMPSPAPPSPLSPPARAPPAPPTPPTPLTPPRVFAEPEPELNLSPISVLTEPSTRQIPRRPVGASPGNNGTSPSASSPDRKATTQQSLSPIPQPIPHPLERRLLDWETKTTDNEASVPGAMLSPSDQEATSHPSEDNTLGALPRTPILRRPVVSQLAPLSTRSETAPVETYKSIPGDVLPMRNRTSTAPTTSQMANTTANPSVPPRMVMPRADQIARLNSRKGRPAGVAGPRRASGSFGQPRAVSGGDEVSLHPAQPATTATPDQHFYSPPPRAAPGSQAPRLSRPNTTYLATPQHNIYNSEQSSRHLSLTNLNTQEAPPPNSNLRPPLPRLETIHSANSAGEGPWVPKPVPVGIGRQPSRAERSAAKNIKDAKKRGWRAAIRKGKEDNPKNKWKRPDANSSPGWTEVSNVAPEIRTRGWNEEKQSKDGKKCTVM